MNGIPRPTTTATPAADPNADRDPIPFGYSGSPYTQHPQPQSYVPHQMVPETFSPQQPGPQQAPRNIFDVAAQHQAAAQQLFSQPQQSAPTDKQPQPQVNHQHSSTSQHDRTRVVISRELAAALSLNTGLSEQDCSAAIDLLREVMDGISYVNNPQRVAQLLLSIAVELNTQTDAR